MMHVEITAIEQTHLLAEHQTVTSLVLKLPSGSVVKVRVGDEDVVAILEANADATVMTEQPRVPKPAQPEMVAAVPDTQRQLIDWMSVEDAVLPPLVKAEMQRRQLPAELPIELIARIANEVMAEATDQSPDERVGVVEHGVPLPRKLAAERRFVETDEAGNPIVPQRQQPADDPGEIFNDETGAQSI